MTSLRTDVRPWWQEALDDGNEQCREPNEACACLLPKGHDGAHRCSHGVWTETRRA